MKTTIAVVLLLCAAPALAGVTPAQLADFLEDEPEDWERELAEVYPLVEDSATDGTLRSAATRLAKLWSIPETAALNLIEAMVISKEDTPDYREQTRQAGERFDTAERLAPDSPKVWALVVDFRRDVLGCSDDLRDQHLGKPFITRPTFVIVACSNWMPEFYRRHPHDISGRFLVIDEMEIQDRVAALAVSRTLLDTLYAPDARSTPEIRRAALRRHWTLLGQVGLGRELLADAATRPPEEIQAVLDGESGRFEIDGIEIDGKYGEDQRRDQARTAWLLALIDAGRLEEAREADAKYGNELTHDLLRGTPAPKSDLFDDYVGDGVEDQGRMGLASNEGVLGMRLAAKFLAANKFDSAAKSLRRDICQHRERGAGMPAPEQLPEDYRAYLATYSRLMAEHDGVDSCPPRAGFGRGTVSSRLSQLPEIPLSETEKALPLRKVVEVDLPLPASFEPVRVEREGRDVVAICISGAVDPGGEVSPGGYWLLRSKDAGRTWAEPLYLGFQMYHPYVVREEGRLPMVAGDTLRLEVDVKELDPESITFPPIALRSRREAHDLYVTIPLARLERDTDGDGFPDLLEAKLHTDANNPDTDGDGISDRFDDFPQVSARAEPDVVAPIVVDLLKKLTGYERAGIVEPMRKGGGEGDLLGGRRRSSAGSMLFTFIEGDPAMFQGLRVNGQVIVLNDEQVRDSQSRHGPMYPLYFPDILFSPDGNRAMVRWSAGWTGGTYMYRKVKGRWESKAVGQWITRHAAKAPRTSPG
jgi:hypothetical protein